jgi:hypothetical protein
VQGSAPELEASPMMPKSLICHSTDDLACTLDLIIGLFREHGFTTISKLSMSSFSGENRVEKKSILLRLHFSEDTPSREPIRLPATGFLRLSVLLREDGRNRTKIELPSVIRPKDSDRMATSSLYGRAEVKIGRIAGVLRAMFAGADRSFA